MAQPITERKFMLSIKDIIGIVSFAGIMATAWQAFEKRMYKVETKQETYDEQQKEQVRGALRLEQKIDLMRDDITDLKIEVKRNGTDKTN